MYFADQLVLPVIEEAAADGYVARPDAIGEEPIIEMSEFFRDDELATAAVELSGGGEKTTGMKDKRGREGQKLIMATWYSNRKVRGSQRQK